jgi:hypothetical protein
VLCAAEKEKLLGLKEGERFKIRRSLSYYFGPTMSVFHPDSKHMENFGEAHEARFPYLD